jgi:hypothetical protein
MLSALRSNILLRFRDRLRIPGLRTRVYRSRGGLWFPETSLVIRRDQNCLALLRRVLGPDAGWAELIPASNIITDAGDIHLAQKAAGEAATNAFGIWEQCSAGTPAKGANRSAFTAIASSQLAQDATYPKTNDGDADNTGAGTDVLTSRASYSAASFNHAAITHAIRTNASPGASEPILTGFAWAASINKAATDTLKVFHNATLNGI